MKIENLTLGWLTVNRACDNRCSWCYAKNSGFSNTDSMDKNLAESLVHLMGSLNVRHISLIGGEPTLYKHLFSVLELIIQKGIIPSITTNGRSFSNYAFAKKFAETGIKDVSVSIKGINREKYTKVANVDGFDEVMKGLDNLRKAGISPSAFFTFDQNSIQEIDDVLDFLLSLEVSEIATNFANPIIVEGRTRSECTPNPREIAQAYTAILKRVQQKKNFFIAPSVPLCLLDDGTKAIAIKRKMLTGTCYTRTGSGLIFSPSGEVIPCHQFTDSTLGKYSVDFNDATSFATFWKGKVCSEFRLKMNYFPSVLCCDCEDWKYCFGGCPIKWFHYNPVDYILKKE